MKKMLPILLLLLLGNTYAQQKAALVVGNNNYKEYPLKNAGNDADLMAKTLQGLGFTVTLLKDAAKADFEKALINFNRDYKTAAIRFFYYAGHGIQFEGENYLVPTDAVLENKEDIRIEGINFSTISTMFQNSKPDAMNIFVLDACRNNPFKNRSWGSRDVEGGDRGLVLKREDFHAGSFAAFSADNGQKASDGDQGNGLYTAVLADELQQPGEEINILFQRVRSRVNQLSNGEQLPVEENRLVGDPFYFKPTTASPPLADMMLKADNTPTSSLKQAENYYNAGNYQSAYAIYKSMNEADLNGRAMQHIGYLYDAGRGVGQDYTLAKTWYEKGANAGDAAAMFNIGLLYQQGHGVAKDSEQAQIWYQKAAATYKSMTETDLDGPAMRNIGIMYDEGHGVGQDYAQAKTWFEKAATAGNSDAMNLMGNMYYRSHGVRQDYAMAKYWYEKADSAGNAGGAFSIGFLYEAGHGVAQDYAQAKTWYEKAAEAGNAAAMLRIGALYYNGHGVAQDYALAKYWYEKAVNAGNIAALNSIGYLYDQGRGVNQDYAQAKYWYEKAADAGNAFAMYNIGVLYDAGHGVVQNYAQAKIWYQKAADAGNADAMNNLGYLYNKGYGTQQDYAQAKYWYEKACAAGNTRACENLRKL